MSHYLAQQPNKKSQIARKPKIKQKTQKNVNNILNSYARSEAPSYAKKIEAYGGGIVGSAGTCQPISCPSVLSFPTMHLQPWTIAVLRVRVYTHPRAATPFSYEVLGTLQDVNWDRTTPIVFGAESENTYLVNSADLGLDLATCMEYKQAVTAHATLLAQYELRWSCATTYDHVAEESYLATVEKLGPVIHSAIEDHFPQWLALQTLTQKATEAPWVGAPVSTPSGATRSEDSTDLYV
jgi:hypothetical protein